MNLPEAPEARQADRPKVEMGAFFDLGNEKATAAAKKAKKVVVFVDPRGLDSFNR